MAVLGHFSPILLTILAPQVFNFIYSLPQLLSVLPSREHRRLSTLVYYLDIIIEGTSPIVGV